MIIEGRANRQPNEPVDPRKRLDFNTPEKLSRVPIYVALIITGVAAYLKSAFPAQSQSDAHTSDEGLPSANSSAPRGGRMSAGSPDIDETTTGSIDQHDPVGGGSLHGWDSSFSMPDPVSFNYASGSASLMGPQVAAFFPAAFNYEPQNDNEAPAGQQGGGDPAGSDHGPPPYQPHDQNPPPLPPVSLTPDDDEEEEDEEDAEEEDDDDGEENNGPASGNRAPVVSEPVRLRDVFAGQVVLIGLSDLLFGASDPDGDILTINDITATGGALVQIGAFWSFATVPGMLGVVTFSYTVSDGLRTVLQTATLEVTRNTVLLTPHDDVFIGTPWDDDVDGLAGDDIIDVRAGNDVVVGGLGDDHIKGGDGDDQLFGGAGHDVIFGGAGDDLIGGGAGNDRLFGEEGNDTIEGNEGDDLLVAGLGDDIVDGGDGDDQLEGNEGNDALVAGAGDDVVSGDEGNDVIEGNDGDDELSGGDGADIVDGGTGDDVIEGNDGDDVLVADAGDDIVSGGEGNDTIDGDDGDDELCGDGGDDIIDGGAGDDVLEGNDGQDTLIAAAGSDVVSGGAGDDQLFGDDGDDTLSGGAGDDQIDAGAGEDTIVGDAGNDWIDGGDGDDTLDYSEFTADIHLDFEAGIAWSVEIDEDLFQNVEEVIGGQGDDTMVFGETTAIISGGLGDDLFIFTVSEETPTLSRQLMFEILDFVVGDRVHVAEYELSHRAERLEEERFGEIYDELAEGFEAGLPIRVTHAYYDDMDHTIIEADVDRNDFYEISITLNGVNLPLTIDQHVA